MEPASDDAENTRADEFLRTFTNLEAWMRRRLRKDAGVPYKKLVEQMRATHLVTESQALQLTTYGYLRNALVHWEKDERGVPVADPRKETVVDFETLAARVMKPPRAIDTIAKQDVSWLSADATVGDFLEIVRKHDFSQVPVLDTEKYVGMLTVGDLAKWISSKSWPAGTDFRRASIRNIPRAQMDDPKFLERDASLTAPEAIAAFGYQTEEAVISGIVIVNRASDSDVVEAVIMPWDLPDLIRATA